MVTYPASNLGQFPFEALFEVNSRCIELLEAMARGPTRGMHPLLYQLRTQLLELTPAARRRAAQSRIILVDFRFGDATSWERIAAGAERGSKVDRNPAFFSRRGSIDLARATLTLAWHAILASPEISAVAFGLHQDVIDTIRQLRIADLERIARARPEYLVPRWGDMLCWWSHLLMAAKDNNQNLQRFVSLHSLQLISVDSNAHRSTPR